MSALGFVKAQRLPQFVSGEDEIFQKELQAIKGKLAKSGPRIYRAGKQPVWLPPEAAISSTATPAAASSSESAHDAASSSAFGGAPMRFDRPTPSLVTGDGLRPRRVEPKMISAASTSTRRPFQAQIVDASGVDADGDATMGEDGDEEMEDDDQAGGRHRATDGGRRRPVAAAVIVAAPAAAAAAATSSIQIDTSQLDVPESCGTDDEEDAEAAALAARRARARANAAAREAEEADALRRQQEEAAKKEADVLLLEEEGEDDEEEESEYESDSDDERRRMMLKPIFRSKAQRSTLADRDRMEAEEVALEADRVARLVARKKDAKLLVLAELQREVAAEQAKAAAGVDVDSDGEPLDEPLDEAFELDLWKLRELRRLKRARDERKEWEDEIKETERRRTMTDAEIEADNQRLGLERKRVGDKTDETQRKFGQRFYHKGAFFTDEDSQKALGDLATRDYNQATSVEAGHDMASLPKAMQVKKFAMKGQTKYTHLVDQDTTRRDENPWARKNTLVEPPRVKGAGAVVPERRHKA